MASNRDLVEDEPEAPDGDAIADAPMAEHDEHVNQDYLEFIKITRRHQAKRAKQRKLQLKKIPQFASEDYYIDISQVDTVVADNLVEVPGRDDPESKFQKREQQLVGLYGGREQYETIRSMEMQIDDLFKKKCQELAPHFWPVIPINPKPYLNPIRKHNPD